MAEKIRVQLSPPRTETCPDCGAGFRSEVTIGSRLEVVCSAGHRFEVVSVDRSVGHDDRYELRDRNP